MTQSLVIRTAPLPIGPAGLVVLYASEGLPPVGVVVGVWE